MTCAHILLSSDIVIHNFKQQACGAIDGLDKNLQRSFVKPCGPDLA